MEEELNKPGKNDKLSNLFLLIFFKHTLFEMVLIFILLEIYFKF